MYMWSVGVSVLGVYVECGSVLGVYVECGSVLGVHVECGSVLGVHVECGSVLGVHVEYGSVLGTLWSQLITDNTSQCLGKIISFTNNLVNLLIICYSL